MYTTYMHTIFLLEYGPSDQHQTIPPSLGSTFSSGEENKREKEPKPIVAESVVSSEFGA